MTQKRLWVGLAATLPALALADTAGSIDVSDPYAFETHKVARAGAGYLTMTNHSDQADRLVAVQHDTFRAEIHQSRTENGVARMEKLSGVDIAPGATVTLAPGGQHIMLMGLAGDPLEAGETVDVILVFERAGPISVTLDVVPRGTSVGHSADHMKNQDQSHSHDTGG